jgi:predicted enzyme related to lactoylglutathione lyase
MTEPSTRSSDVARPYEAAAPSSGRFVWHDLMTTDPAKALGFYRALFGWETRPWDMGGGETYEMLYAGEHGIGGVMPLDASAGIPSHWIGYLTVADVDAACAEAERAGAKSCVPPTDIPTVGRFAVVEDLDGAVFSPFKSSCPPMPEPKNAPPGTIAWNELLTSDPERAGKFYSALTGWRVEKMDMGPMGFYWLYKRGDANAAGMMRMPENAGERPHWLPYVAVASCDASAARAAELGATVVVEPTDIEQWGRFAVALDPAGAVFGVLENKQPM